MKERPILFSAPMVRAILDGSKTQTRRVVKPAPLMITDRATAPWEGPADALLKLLEQTGRHCPYGQPGDRLWVREAFAFTDAHMAEYECSIEYRADSKCLAIAPGRELIDVPHGCDPRPFAGPWKPSIHMPRWASRILLEIVSVRVERLKDCSREDAAAEGVCYLARTNWEVRRKVPCGESVIQPTMWPEQNFGRLWEHINGVGSWDANPWVWVVEFKKVIA